MARTSVCVFAVALTSCAAYFFESHQKVNPSLVAVSGGAPAGAPGGAPGAAPAASPAAPKDSWGADSHAEEFTNEYTFHTREGLKEPHVGEKGWISETHANVANFDPHGRDFLTDSRSPVTFSGAVTHTVAVTTLLLFFLH